MGSTEPGFADRIAVAPALAEPTAFLEEVRRIAVSEGSQWVFGGGWG